MTFATLKRESLLVAGFCFALGACTTSTELRPNSQTATSGADVAMRCPLGVPGARVSTEVSRDGVALIFAAPDRLGELRARARHAAEMHGPAGHLGLGHDGKHDQGGQHGLQAMQLPPSRATVTDIDGGVRLDLTPAYAADRDILIAKAGAGAERMNNVTCR